MLVAFERLLVLLLLELCVAQIVIGFGQLRLRTQRVGGGLPEGLFGAVEAFGLVEGVAEVVGGLELPRDGFERLLVTADRLLVIALGVLPVAVRSMRALSGSSSARIASMISSEVISIAPMFQRAAM